MAQLSVPISLLGKASDSPDVQALLAQGAAKDPKDLAAMLGKPEWSSSFLHLDRWLVDKTWFFAKYVDPPDRMETFSMQVPDR